MEKLCQAFENGKDLVELSDHSPHDICNVLKLYLRQVGLTCLNIMSLSKVRIRCPAVFSVALLQIFVIKVCFYWYFRLTPPAHLQLPEPLILYRCYNDLIGLAKECQQANVEEAVRLQNNPAGDSLGPNVQLNKVILKIRDFLRQLPTANYRTLRFLIAHLHR